ncbi:MAG: GNAT family N-acetyltransferase [Planctomycetaceae bacterium]
MLDVEHLDLVSRWLGEKENYQWLDFGAGHQVIARTALALMRQRDHHCFRLQFAGEGGPPVGLVALSNISPNFRSAMLWYLLGDKRHAGKGITRRGVEEILRHAFGPLGLHSVYAWCVVENAPSQRILQRSGFREIGRQRECHFIDGRPHDRMLYDLLAREFTG